jgi:hypothetical protein
MDKENEWISFIYTYFRMLEKINITLKKTINNNMDMSEEEKEDNFFEMTTQLLRLMPFKVENGITRVEKDGILKIKDLKDFIEPKYENILSKYNDVLCNIIRIRNKFIHEPHNIKWAFIVGGDTSCSIGFYYKFELISISTMDITNIVYELNTVMDEIQAKANTIIKAFEEEKRTHPYLLNIMSFDFKKHNSGYTRVIKQAEN